MKNLDEIINDYTSGKVGLEDTNKALKEAGSGLQLDPTRNLFSAQELMVAMCETFGIELDEDDVADVEFDALNDEE